MNLNRWWVTWDYFENTFGVSVQSFPERCDYESKMFYIGKKLPLISYKERAERHRISCRKYQLKYRENNLEHVRKLEKARRLRNPHKYPPTPRNRARQILNNAIIYRGFPKPKNCSLCGAIGRIEGHHRDYTKPLEVIWLCTICHGKEHRYVKV